MEAVSCASAVERGTFFMERVGYLQLVEDPSMEGHGLFINTTLGI